MRKSEALKLKSGAEVFDCSYKKNFVVTKIWTSPFSLHRIVYVDGVFADGNRIYTTHKNVRRVSD